MGGLSAEYGVVVLELGSAVGATEAVRTSDAVRSTSLRESSFALRASSCVSFSVAQKSKEDGQMTATNERAEYVESVCEYDGCEKVATSIVRTVLGRKSFCPNHAYLVRSIERDWDEAEAAYLDQNL